MEEITERKIIEDFDNDKEIWPKSDKWHYYCRSKINAFIKKNVAITDASKNVINAGSSGESYDIPDEKTTHVDLILSKIQNKPKYIVANVQQIPLESACSDLVVCVGSVINYSDALRTIKEFSRLCEKNGYLILEFECSNTLELVFSRKFNSNITKQRTFYREERAIIWYYSENYVKGLLAEFDFEMIDIEKWHYFSPLVLRITGKGNFSSYFKSLDPLLKRTPFLNKFSSNVIVLARKK